MKAVSRVLQLLLLGGMLACVTEARRLAAADDPAFEKSSLAWRTALHFDPAAQAPLTSLLQLYQQSGRVNELVNLYVQHLTQFPSDEGAKVVLARLYLLTVDTRAEEFIRQATAAHPQNASLVYIQAQWLQSKLDPRALETFDKAIELETTPVRRAQWLADLLKMAVPAQREDIITARFKALVKEGTLTPAQRLQWARQSLEQGFAKSAEVVLEGETFASLQGDDLAEAGFTRARVALANGHRADAALIARDLLDKLAPDHWRYREALTLRWQAAADDQERTRLLSDSAKAWKTTPASESAALAYGDLLVTTDSKAEALRIWSETLAQVPGSRLLEERVLNLLEQMHRDEEVLTFLAERVKLQPEREDLALQRARGLLVLGRMDDGMAALDHLLAKADVSVRASTLLQTARWLRVRQLFGEGARVLESLLALEPQRWEARKELAELYLLLKRQEDMERLFTVEMAEDVPADVRLEVAQFLVAKKLWRQAQHLLETWVAKRAAEFDARLLLAKVKALLGDESSAARLLAECRALSDTDARYAAWLMTAWERAAEQEKTAEFVEQERARLWPSEGTTWDAARLAKLSLLAQQTMLPKERVDAEKLLRQTLAAPTLPVAQRVELRLQLIQTLEGQTGREKELEAELTKALAEPGAAKGDLQVRLALMYHAAKRFDLARSAMAQVNPEACQNAVLLSRAAAVAAEVGAADLTTSCYARLVRLQPDERANWNNWIGRLLERQDEVTLRLALRETLARTKAWNLSAASQDLLRRHLAASYWRSVARLLTQDDRAGEILPFLDELERTELSPQRRLWAVWVRGVAARKLGDAAAIANAQSLLTASKEEWISFPDGLSLSLTEARKLLSTSGREPLTAVESQPNQKEDSVPLPPLALAWAFTMAGAGELQRWDLTPDGMAVLVADSLNRIYLLDRLTGKLLWQRPLPKNIDAPLPALNPNSRGEEQILYPPEWTFTGERLCIARQGALFGLSLKDGSLLWQVSALAAKDDGCLASHEGRVLWWHAAEARLDAIDDDNGRLIWTRGLPELAGPAAINPQNPQWLAAGIHAADGKVLVCGDGSAVLRVKDGAILWRAAAGVDAPSFPLELSAEGRAVLPKQEAVTIAWTSSAATSAGRRPFANASAPRAFYANVLAAPGYGFPGMYGNAQASPWVYWGAEQMRLLRGDGIWNTGSAGAQRYSVLGLPTRSGTAQADYFRTMFAVGFAGRALVGVSENSVINYDPVRGSTTLWNSQGSWNGFTDHPLPNAALAGRTLLLASQDVLRIQDAVTGTIVWEGTWPEDAKPLVKTARESLQPWQSVRWTAHGVFLYNGQGRTLTVDWKGLSAHGDWIVPVGTRTLVALRSDKSASQR